MPPLEEPYVLRDPERLADLMQQHHLSYRALADKAHMAKTPIHKLRTGKQKTISYPNAERIAKALNCEVSDLFRPQHAPEGEG